MDKEKRIEELCEQIRSGDNKAALLAVDELHENGWLFDGSLYRARLSGADLSGANLNRATLYVTTLYGANLSGALLRNANLRGANLNKAIMYHTNLSGAHLSGANLSNVNLSGANLSNANLSGATLYETTFTEAIFEGTVLAGIDLSKVTGLNTVIHAGPSYISVDTVYKSKGEIPSVFLKGCGVPDDYIEHILPLAGKVIEFYSCFISYSHAQKEFARRLHDRLQGAGIRCWLDEHQVKPGQDIYEEVNRGIRLWDKVLLCCSEESLTSWWVDNEVGTALEKEQELMKERGKKVRAIIPLNLDGYMFDGWESGYAAEIRRRLAADFRNWKEHDMFEAEFQKVLAVLRTDGGREEPPVSRL